jgi:hypothetical protein
MNQNPYHRDPDAHPGQRSETASSRPNPYHRDPNAHPPQTAKRTETASSRPNPHPHTAQRSRLDSDTGINHRAVTNWNSGSNAARHSDAHPPQTAKRTETASSRPNPHPHTAQRSRPDSDTGFNHPAVTDWNSRSNAAGRSEQQRRVPTWNSGSIAASNSIEQQHDKTPYPSYQYKPRASWGVTPLVPAVEGGGRNSWDTPHPNNNIITRTHNHGKNNRSRNNREPPPSATCIQDICVEHQSFQITGKLIWGRPAMGNQDDNNFVIVVDDDTSSINAVFFASAGVHYSQAMKSAVERGGSVQISGGRVQLRQIDYKDVKIDSPFEIVFDSKSKFMSIQFLDPHWDTMDPTYDTLNGSFMNHVHHFPATESSNIQYFSMEDDDYVGNGEKPAFHEEVSEMISAPVNDETLVARATTAMKDYIGHTDFRDNQLQIILDILRGKDTLVVHPTGSGKSLLHQVSGIVDGQHDGKTTLVVFPTLVLMFDQMKKLRNLPEGKVKIYCGRYKDKLDGLLDKATRPFFIFTVPESLVQSPYLKQQLRTLADLKAIARIVFDEAHLLVSWGDSFRPDCGLMGAVRESLSTDGGADASLVPILCLSATVPGYIKERLLRTLGVAKLQVYQSSLDRPHITLEIDSKPFGTKAADNLAQNMATRIKNEFKGKVGIIYSATQSSTENLYKLLLELDCGREKDKIGVFHSGLNWSDLRNTYNSFMEGKLNLVVATSGFGLGIDKASAFLWFIVHVVI